MTEESFGLHHKPFANLRSLRVAKFSQDARVESPTHVEGNKDGLVQEGSRCPVLHEKPGGAAKHQRAQKAGVQSHLARRPCAMPSHIAPPQQCTLFDSTDLTTSARPCSAAAATGVKDSGVSATTALPSTRAPGACRSNLVKDGVTAQISIWPEVRVSCARLSTL